MTEPQTFFITGTSRGMGTEFARAALDAGHHVVATGRDPERVVASVGQHDELLAVALDVTDERTVRSAVDAAIERFGRIDVLVNNAGSFQGGFFEEVSPEQFRAQMETNFFGAMNVTRAVLPVMRAQGSGRVISISSTAGIVAGAGGARTPRRSSRSRGGWKRCTTRSCRSASTPRSSSPASSGPTCSRRAAPRSGGTSTSTTTAPASDQTKEFFRGMEGKQSGDPAKLARTLLALTEMSAPPVRLVAGADSVEGPCGRRSSLIEQARAFPELTTSLDLDDQSN
ncbi:SDR family NAD(P)-dependent oxidoreductase [Sphingomonas sp. LR61]